MNKERFVTSCELGQKSAVHSVRVYLLMHIIAVYFWQVPDETAAVEMGLRFEKFFWGAI